MSHTIIPPIDKTLEETAKRIKGYRPIATFRQPQASRKQDFLSSLRSTGKLEYKRYLASPLRYAGGKSLAVGFVVDLLPDNLQRIVSPFMGGSSIEIACANEIELEVVAYDVFDILCNYWQVQLTAPGALAKRMRAFEPNRSTFKRVKERLQQHWQGGKCLNRYDLAAHYYFNSNTSYGPHFLGWPSDVYLNPSRYMKMVDKSANFRAPFLSVECRSFEDSIPMHKGDFLYCDPPIILKKEKLSLACIHTAIFRSITRASVMTYSETICWRTGAVSFFPITTAT